MGDSTVVHAWPCWPVGKDISVCAWKEVCVYTRREFIYHTFQPADYLKQYPELLQCAISIPIPSLEQNIEIIEDLESINFANDLYSTFSIVEDNIYPLIKQEKA